MIFTPQIEMGSNANMNIPFLPFGFKTDSSTICLVCVYGQKEFCQGLRICRPNPPVRTVFLTNPFQVPNRKVPNRKVFLISRTEQTRTHFWRTEPFGEPAVRFVKMVPNPKNHGSNRIGSFQFQ